MCSVILMPDDDTCGFEGEPTTKTWLEVLGKWINLISSNPSLPSCICNCGMPYRQLYGLKLSIYGPIGLHAMGNV